jgi:hypothetical protein
MRGKSLQHFPAEVFRDGDGFRVNVTTVGESGRFLPNLSGEMLLVDAEGKQSTILLKPNNTHKTTPPGEPDEVTGLLNCQPPNYPRRRDRPRFV